MLAALWERLALKMLILESAGQLKTRIGLMVSGRKTDHRRPQSDDQQRVQIVPEK